MATAVIDKIRKLEEERSKLLEEAKEQAMQKAHEALDELAELGFNYHLVSKDAPTRAPRTPGSGTRRSGIRDDVYNAVSAAGADGIAPAAIRASLGIEDGDKSGYQSVANALSALKRTNKITDNNGSYFAV